MSEHYFIVSLPYCQGVDASPNAQFTHLQKEMGPLGAALRHFIIPALKIGTLDSLMEASDDLAKVDPLLEGTCAKIASILEEATQRPRAAVCSLRINQSQELSCDSYLKHYGWNTAQFDTKDSVKALIEALQSTATYADERIRAPLTEYSEARNKLTAANRKGQGNLAMRSINDLVRLWARRENEEVLNTEFLTTVFVAVPNGQVKHFLQTYWTMHEFVCPKSASVVADDSEFTLFAVTVFKRAAEDFKMACRKAKYMIRDLDGDSPTADGAQESVAQLQQAVEQQKSSLVAMLTLQFSVCYVAWIHCKALRIFVESMLKYGLPPKFVPVLLAVDEAREKQIRKKLSQIHADLNSQIEADSMDTGALQYEFPYVSLKVANLAK